jgi:hypothetical protein
MKPPTPLTSSHGSRGSADGCSDPLGGGSGAESVMDSEHIRRVQRHGIGCQKASAPLSSG